MAHNESVPGYTDPEALKREGDWGVMHEIGHNHRTCV